MSGLEVQEPSAFTREGLANHFRDLVDYFDALIKINKAMAKNGVSRNGVLSFNNQLKDETGGRRIDLTSQDVKELNELFRYELKDLKRIFRDSKKLNKKGQQRSSANVPVILSDSLIAFFSTANFGKFDEKGTDVDIKEYLEGLRAGLAIKNCLVMLFMIHIKVEDLAESPVKGTSASGRATTSQMIRFSPAMMRAFGAVGMYDYTNTLVDRSGKQEVGKVVASGTLSTIENLVQKSNLLGEKAFDPKYCTRFTVNSIISLNARRATTSEIEARGGLNRALEEYRFVANNRKDFPRFSAEQLEAQRAKEERAAIDKRMKAQSRPKKTKTVRRRARDDARII